MPRRRGEAFHVTGRREGVSDFRDDLRIRRGALRHPKILLLRKRLGAEAVLSLIALWDHAAGNRWKGSLAGMTDPEIEAAADWCGAEGAWIAAASALRLLDGDELSRSIHGWEEAQPWIFHREERLAAAKTSGRRGGRAGVRSRESARKRKPKATVEGTLEATVDGTVNTTLKAFQPPSPYPYPSPSPYPSPTPTPTPTPHTEESPLPPKGVTVSVPEALTQDRVAKMLKARLGSSLNPCRGQVAALVGAGWDLARIVEAVEAHAEPGLAPWDWTKRARGIENRIPPARNVPNTAEILEVGRKLAALPNDLLSIFPLRGGRHDP